RSPAGGNGAKDLAEVGKVVARARKLSTHMAKLVLHDRQGTLFEVTLGRGRRRPRQGFLEVRDGSLIWYPKSRHRGWRLPWSDLSKDGDPPRWRPGVRAFDARKFRSRRRT